MFAGADPRGFGRVAPNSAKAQTDTAQFTPSSRGGGDVSLVLTLRSVRAIFALPNSEEAGAGASIFSPAGGNNSEGDRFENHLLLIRADVFNYKFRGILVGIHWQPNPLGKGKFKGPAHTCGERENKQLSAQTKALIGPR